MSPQNRDGGDAARDTSFTTHGSAFLGDGAFHEGHHEHERKRHHGENPEAVEVGKGGSLLLAEVLERLPGLLLQGSWVTGALVCLCLLDEGVRPD